MGLSKTEYFTDRQNEIADLFKAVGHPARVAILQHILKTQGCICNDIVNELPLAQPTVSQHLKELKNAGIIKGTISGKSVCYCLNTDKWNLIKDFVADFFNPAYVSCCQVPQPDAVRFVEDDKYLPAALDLIALSGLPTDDIRDGLSNMLCAEKQGQLVGVVGLEIYGRNGFLRSLAVDPEYRGQSLGKQLTERILFRARAKNLDAVYLLTNTAETFFEKLGFVHMDRDDMPEAIQATPEFTQLCPGSAVAMKYDIDHSSKN